MTDPDLLRLAAIDEEDLAVISAYVQDAVLKVGDMVYLPKEHRFALAMNRFTWEKAGDGPQARLRAPPRRADFRSGRRGPDERHRSLPARCGAGTAGGELHRR